MRVDTAVWKHNSAAVKLGTHRQKRRGLKGAVLFAAVLCAALLSAVVWPASRCSTVVREFPPSKWRTPHPTEIDRVVEKAMVDWNVPGLALAVVKDDRVVMAKGYGIGRVGHPEKVNADTLFGLMSPTKSFTATALAMLVEGGKISWDDPVVEHLPDFRLSDPEATAHLKVRDLVSHRSGYADRLSLWHRSGLSAREVASRAYELERKAPYAREFHYNNVLFVVAGELIARVSGERWDSFVTRRILRPAGMDRTFASGRALKGQSNVASPHVRRLFGLGKTVPVAYYDPSPVAPAGGLYSTARDLTKWLRLNLAGGIIEEQRLLLPNSFDPLWTPHITMASVPPHMCGVAASESYGLGWFLFDYRGQSMVMHGGGITGQRSAVVLLPEMGLGIAVLSNMDETEVAQHVAFAIADLYLGADPRDWKGAF